MMFRQAGVALAMVVVNLIFCLHAQIQSMQRSFYAEQRLEVWYEDGRRDEDVIRITRLANRSFLAMHPLHSVKDRMRHIGGYYFYLVDTEALVEYSGETALRAAWPLYMDSAVPGQNKMVDQYGDCSVLADDSIKKVPAGKIRRFAVLRIERVEGRERYTTWIAPELGCFPLRSQVLVDELVRERVETVRLDLLPAQTRLSIPKGVRIVSPKKYCDIYQKRYGQEYLPQRVCDKYEKIYQEVKAAKRQRSSPRAGFANAADHGATGYACRRSSRVGSARLTPSTRRDDC